ncbi:MAG: hypothetical protein R3F59_01565 [Myxococcota bacterium]
MRTPLLALVALASGCVINSDKWPRPRDLTPDWEVSETRILGIRADPPEIRPGDTVAFDALFGAPPGSDGEVGDNGIPADRSVLWLACPVDDEGNGFGCLTDLGDVDLATADPADLASLGFVGFEPGLAPSYTAPADLLDGLDEQARLEGRYVLVQLLAFPTALLQDPDALANLDFSVVVSAYKRLVVSDAPTPNHNPDIGVFVVDGLPIPPGAVVTVEPDQRYDLSVALPEGAIESYDYENSDGVVEQRVEEPYASWYTTGGEMLEEVTLWPRLEATWQAPKETLDRGFWYIVLRDRRGGVSWYTQEFTIGRPTGR